jgi:hypothetical protein
VTPRLFPTSSSLLSRYNELSGQAMRPKLRLAAGAVVSVKHCSNQIVAYLRLSGARSNRYCPNSTLDVIVADRSSGAAACVIPFMSQQLVGTKWERQLRRCGWPAQSISWLPDRKVLARAAVRWATSQADTRGVDRSDDRTAPVAASASVRSGVARWGMESDHELVAVFEISDSASDDRWADASWQAGLAIRQAAIEASASVDEIARAYRFLTGESSRPE